MPCDVYMVNPRKDKFRGLTISMNGINRACFKLNLIGVKSNAKEIISVGLDFVGFCLLYHVIHLCELQKLTEGTKNS